MSKKINLTQFEGHIEKLRLDEYGPNLYIEVPPNRPVGAWNEWKGGVIFDLGEKAAMGEGLIPTARLMAASPDLIAELERLYAFEEELEYLFFVAHGHDCDWCKEAEEDISEFCKDDYRCFLREHFASE